MKILITGNNGYIGPILEKILLARGHETVGLDTNYFEDLLFYKNVVERKQIVKDIRAIEAADLEGVDAVVHLAALSNDPMGSMDDKLTDQINYQSTKTLANLCKSMQVRRFIYASSCSMYGLSSEKALTEDSPLNPKTAYARSKVSSENHLSSIADDDFSPTLLRFSTAFGVSPRMRVDLVLNNLVAWAVTTGKIKIMSDGTPWRPIVHIADMSNAICVALEAPIEKVHNQAFNVGKPGNNYQIRDMAAAVKKCVPGCEVEYTNEHGSDSRSYNVNFDKIHRILPDFNPLWDLEKGVDEIYRAYVEHGLTFNEFRGNRYIRLKRLQYLKSIGKLDEQLFWTKKSMVHNRYSTQNYPFKDTYNGKRVLITGHTGFKGTWLSTWLLNLGADVVGYSVGIPTNPSNFEVLNLEKRLVHITGDVNDLEHLHQVFNDYSPDIVFHLAAQAITRLSYDIPQGTFYTNVVGTVNVLECIRRSKSTQAAVIITSDKCYQNNEWMWGYRESDVLGGDDPYSASKACAEIACHSYIMSYFSKDNLPRISTARAGNVMGGGDWAIDRVVPDCMKAFFGNKSLELRNPKATRPWQHVLEPLSGYLWLGVHLLERNNEAVNTPFNFGPLSGNKKTVEELVTGFNEILKKGEWFISENDNMEKRESNILRLNCEKALTFLDWHAVLSFEETIKLTAEWYNDFYCSNNGNMYDATIKQIEEYEDLALKRGLGWAEH